MYLRICMKTKFRQLHFRGRSTLHKIGEFYLSDHGRQPQFGQNAILARSKAKIRNWKIINCFFYICAKPFSRTKNEGKLFLVPKSSGPLLAGLPLKWVEFGEIFCGLFLFKIIKFRRKELHSLKVVREYYYYFSPSVKPLWIARSDSLFDLILHAFFDQFI